MTDYHSLNPKEGKDDPQGVSDSGLDDLCATTRLLRLRKGNFETHPAITQIGIVDIRGQSIIKKATSKTKDQLC